MKRIKNVSGAHYRDIVYGNYSNALKILLSLILIRFFYFSHNFNKTIKPKKCYYIIQPNRWKLGNEKLT